MADEFDLIPGPLADYIGLHSSSVDAVLEELERDTHVNVLCPRMLSGAYQGKLLEMLSRMIRPARILEIGTYTGYSAICLARGLAPGGELVTVEHNPELEKRILRYVEKAGLSDRVRLMVGEASDILSGMQENSFDLVFLDADKENYGNYYPLLKKILVPGGWMLVDNMLWNGKVMEYRYRDRDTQAVRALNDAIQQDPEVENVLLPVRDGIMLVHKLK